MGSSGRVAAASGLHYCVDCSTVLELTAGAEAPSCPTCNHGTTWCDVRHAHESASLGEAPGADFED